MKTIFLTSFTAIFVVFSFSVHAQLTYNTNNGAIIITGCTGSPTNIIIPASINGYPVTTIGDEAFYDYTSLTSVTIPGSVISIGMQSFFACYNLTNITMTNGITSIGYDAFFVCEKLASITIPNTVTNIGVFAFGQCNSLTKVAIPDSVISIGNYAFYVCPNLASVTISDSVTSIGEDVFLGCTSLTNITVAPFNPNYNSVNGVLFNKTQTTLIDFPAGLLSRSYTIPSIVTNIAEDAFFDCSNLTDITFLGDAPALENSTVFYGVHSGATVYYYYGTSGWSTIFGGLSTVMLDAPVPDVGLASIQSGNFGFNITGVTNQIVTVEVSTNLVNWRPIWTNTLSGTFTNFTDAEWTNYLQRFYRAY